MILFRHKCFKKGWPQHVLNKTDTKVYRFYQGFEDDIEPDCFGDFDDFLLEYVFGDKYAKIIPKAYEDEWYRLLKKLNLFWICHK